MLRRRGRDQEPRRAAARTARAHARFALLALLGVAEWARMFEGGGLRDGLPWVLAAVLAGEMAGAAALAVAAHAGARRDAGRARSG